MIDTFCEYFEGTFNNKMQAMSYPTKFAMIELVHEKIDDYKFRVVQRYYVDKRPYRKSVVEIVPHGTDILVQNYKDDQELTYLPGCDILFNVKGEEFHGKNICKDCFVTWSGKETYLQTQSILRKDSYLVIDRGYDVYTDEHIWGSFHGHFKFIKSPL